MKLYYLSDNLFEVTLIDEATDAALTTGTVTLTFYDDAADPETTIGSNVTLSHVASGLWRGTIPDDQGFALGQRVRMKLIADHGAGLRLERHFKLLVVQMQASP